MIKEVGALIWKETDSMSHLRFRMNKADKAMWMDMKILQKKRRNCLRKHKRYREVVLNPTP